ncbi:MAG: nuclear transport factor 2 family protein [Desulfobacterales bacterium]|nr:MAG: nuclear transport factor 2 family protein [Desulfobacterales bacterium]
MTEIQDSKQLEAAKLVKNFLRAMENRDLAAAADMMAEDAKIVFPGGKVFNNQEEMVTDARGRYQWIKKAFEQIDTAALPQGGIAVYIKGTLYGLNNFGVKFAGVRYIDRFVVKDGLIVSQEVWNDLAESGVLTLTS